MSQRCIIWGAGKYGKRLRRMLSEEGYEIVAYCDIDEGLAGKKVDNYEIISIDKTIDMCYADESLKVIIGVFDHNCIKKIKKTIDDRFPQNTEVKIGHDLQDEIENRKLEEYHQNMSFKWEIDLEKYILSWFDNIMSEVRFWVKSVADLYGRSHEYNIRCRENNRFLYTNIFHKIKANQIVMDIGCGLMSKFGNQLENGDTIQLIPVDALAYFYNNINSRIVDGLKEDYVCRFGLFEFWGNIFGQNYADYIIIENALDHGIDPWRSLVECLYVLKPDGCMYLSHRRAEAVFEGWNGLHKWNIDCMNGELIIWNKENAINISERLKQFVDIRIRYDDTVNIRERQSISVEIIKKKNFSLEDFFDIHQENIILTRCIEKLMEKFASENKNFIDMLEHAHLV